MLFPLADSSLVVAAVRFPLVQLICFWSCDMMIQDRVSIIWVERILIHSTELMPLAVNVPQAALDARELSGCVHSNQVSRSAK